MSGLKQPQNLAKVPTFHDLSWTWFRKHISSWLTHVFIRNIPYISHIIPYFIHIPYFSHRSQNITSPTGKSNNSSCGHAPSNSLARVPSPTAVGMICGLYVTVCRYIRYYVYIYINTIYYSSTHVHIYIYILDKYIYCIYRQIYIYIYIVYIYIYIHIYIVIHCIYIYVRVLCTRWSPPGS